MGSPPPILIAENEDMANWLKQLIRKKSHLRRSLCLYIGATFKITANHKPIYLIYCELELTQRIKPQKRIKYANPRRCWHLKNLMKLTLSMSWLIKWQAAVQHEHRRSKTNLISKAWAEKYDVRLDHIQLDKHL